MPTKLKKQNREMQKTNPIDSFFKYLINNYLYEIAAALLILASLAIRIYLTRFKFAGSYISGDYNNYLTVWVNQYRELGIVDGLKMRVGTYYVPYNLYLALLSVLPVDEGIWIPVLSCLFEYIGIFFIYRILLLLIEGRSAFTVIGLNKRALFTSILVLFFPVCFLNGTIWKQCDSIYTCFILIGLYLLLRKRFTFSFFIFSIAFVFKLQTVFFVPFLLMVYILYAEFSILEFLWFPGMYLLAGLPAIACGRSALDTYGTYFRQGEIYKMTVGFPNIYCLGIDSYEAMAFPAMFICASVFIFAACFIKRREKFVTPGLLIVMAGWLFMTCPMFLPGMHSRYDYPAILLITVYALALDINMAPAAAVMNVVPIFTYGSYLFHMGDNLVTYQTLALMYLFAYLYTAMYIYLRLTKYPLPRDGSGDKTSAGA